MKELMKTQRISVSVIGYLAILLLGFLSIQKPGHNLELDSSQMAELLDALEYEVFPEDVDAYLYSEDQKYVFVDVRHKYEFEVDHIENAINIPSIEIFEKENIKKLEQMQNDTVIVVFYGNDQLEANGPWMVMTQMGFTNTKVLLGGFYAYSKLVYDYEEVNYFDEEPAMEFATIIENGASEDFYNTITAPETIVPVERVKNDIEEGGC
ncbi:MAG: rhodanese-like domain-containing protein [Bacteroidales bacterium]|jgi:rhodanese-related sulfurtransferase|nr:rhodanese-like domain-containing protein [Bacteroidales bacterium]